MAGYPPVPSGTIYTKGGWWGNSVGTSKVRARDTGASGGGGVGAGWAGGAGRADQSFWRNGRPLFSELAFLQVVNAAGITELRDYEAFFQELAFLQVANDDGMTGLRHYEPFPRNWHSCKWRTMTELRDYGITKLFPGTAFLQVANAAGIPESQNTGPFSQGLAFLQVANDAGIPELPAEPALPEYRYSGPFLRELTFLQVVKDTGIASLFLCVLGLWA